MQSLLGQGEEASAAPSDIAAALSRINDQLAIQNRRRSRIWKIIAWIVGLCVAFNVLLLVLGYAGMVQYAGETHTEAYTINVEEAE